MSDSDDEFSDGIVLDDQMLAVLDEEESRFQRATQPNAGDTGPPAKRRKLDTGHPLNLGIFGSSTSEDTEDLPDITVRSDGTYVVEPQGPTGPALSVELNGNMKPPTRISKPAVMPSNNPGYTAPARRNPTNHAPRLQSSQFRRPASRNPSQVPSAQVQAQPIPHHQSNSIPHTVASPPTAFFDAQLADMRKLMNELRKDNEKMQAELKRTLDAKLARDGEVSILRKNIEKTAQDHAAQIAKLRVAKEESETRQMQMQKEMKEEAERLKTQFTFRQLEIETSIRKSSPKKILMTSPAKYPSLPSQIQTCDQNRAVAGSSRVTESPTRPRFGEIAKNERARKLMAENRNLPSGFQTSTPLATSGKGKAPDRSKRSSLNVPFDSGSLLTSPSMGGAQIPLQAAQGDIYGAIGHNDGFMDDAIANANLPLQDVEMIDGTQDPQLPATVEEKTEEVEPHRWIMDLHRIVLMHIEPSCGMTTLQALLGVSLPSGPNSDAYTSACSRILDVLAYMPSQDHQNLADATRTICMALTEMAVVLAASDHIASLAALLNQLTQLTYTLPSPHQCLLVDGVADAEENVIPRILAVICSVIVDYVSKLGNDETERSNLGILAKESLTLLEALCWSTPSHLENRLAFVPSNPVVLSALLDQSRPTWFILYSTRVLSWLAYRPTLFRSLLSFPDNEGDRQDYTKLPLIERMCSLLIDSSRTDEEADGIKRNVLKFFAMLSMAHPSAHVIIIESQSVIPSITSYLYELSALVWQDDEALESDPQAASRVIQRMNQTTFLLHHLIFRAEIDPRLRERLEYAPRDYNGVVHLFIVATSRLSFADVPEWVQGKDKQELEKVAGLARELLELMVEGPELDAIWATYQEEPDEELEDDEEVEARRLDANEI